MAKLAIKSDNKKQNLLFPPSLDELVPKNHMVRVVDAVIDRLDISEILSTYHGGGNSAFNPKMMLKVLVFAYLSNVYSSRRIEELLRRDVYLMWLSGMKRPDFRTINYYRGKRLKDGFDSVFTQVVELLHEEGFVSLKVQYVDGTKKSSPTATFMSARWDRKWNLSDRKSAIRQVVTNRQSAFIGRPDARDVHFGDSVINQNATDR